jgi:hypothetical protein
MRLRDNCGVSGAAEFVIPTAIPWAHLTAAALEETLYWLCERMGAKDLEWRAGSAAGTSPDGGRDIEATFYVSEPSGDLRPERWWLQAKGRSRTVEPDAVKSAVVSAASRQDLGVFVIGTNSRFSNDTRDWIREYQQAHPRPSIRLWDRSDLERMLLSHPSVVARVAPHALSPQGRLEAAKQSFWNGMRFATAADLAVLWAERERLAFTEHHWLACVIAEAASGDFTERPWAAHIDAERLPAVLTIALASAPSLVLRLADSGSDTQPVLEAIVHLLAGSIARTDAHVVAAILANPWEFVEGVAWPQAARDMFRERIFRPAVGRLMQHYGSACLADCVRVSGEIEDLETDPTTRWFSLVPPTLGRPAETGRGHLIVEKDDAPCNAGLALDKERRCPFVRWEDMDWDELVAVLHIVLRNRVAQVSTAKPTAH